MNLKMAFTQAIVVLLVITTIIGGVFYGAYTYVNTLDVSTIDPTWVPLVTLFKNFFASQAVAFLITFIYNIWGYAKNKSNALAAGTKIEYDLNKYFGSLAYYGGGLAIVFIALPTPYNAIGTAIVFFLKLSGSVIGDVFAK
jgi:hypothetical protein